MRPSSGITTLTLALALAAASPVPAAGQETTTAPGEAQPNQLQAQKPGQVLRAFTTDGRLLTGRFVMASADSVILSLEGGSADRTSLDLSSLDGIDARHRSTKRGAWILGVSGALGGGLVGGVFNQLCESACDRDGQVILTMAAFGGLAGAGLGAIIGAAIPQWRRIWP